MAFIETISSAYKKHQTHLIYILLVILSISSFIQNQAIKIASLTSIGLILIKMISDIHSLLVEKTEYHTNVYEDFYKTVPDIKRILKGEFSKKNKIHLKWIGTSMDSGLYFIRNTLRDAIEESNNNLSIEMEIAMLSNNWKDIDKFNELWKDESKTNIDIIKRCIYNKNNKQLNITIYTHEFVPSITGLLINDTYLFCAECMWKNGQYCVGMNKYNLYKNKTSKIKNIHIEQYKKWFDFYKENSVHVY
jgi:hypothetical protein